MKRPSSVVPIHQRLLNLSRERREDFNLVLTRYANERFLYRLAQSAYGDRFVLNGAMLFTIWTGQAHRPTRDVDLLGYGNNSEEALVGIFKDVCAVDVEADGVMFDADSLKVTEIRKDQDYQGKRIQLNAVLGNARIPLQIDIGFGDVVIPSVEQIEYPVMLNFPAPKLAVYSKETFIAEKFQAMVTLGFVNSRMKDFYDIWMMTKQFSFEGRVLGQAIRATFQRRQTKLPETPPVALTVEFSGDPGKEQQWRAFLARNGLDSNNISFSGVIDDLRDFLMPLMSETEATWLPGNPRQNSRVDPVPKP